MIFDNRHVSNYSSLSEIENNLLPMIALCFYQIWYSLVHMSVRKSGEKFAEKCKVKWKQKEKIVKKR